MIAPNSGAAEYLASLSGLPQLTLPSGEKIQRPCKSWTTWQMRWRFLLDSWEGGEVYRMAVYGQDVRGFPIRNLIRHKREYPTQQESSYSMQSGRPAGTDPAAQAFDDDYELRRARTPVPTFLADVTKRHLGKIYSQEIEREGPPALVEWWKDVNGEDTSIDEWMSVTVAPLLMVLGQLDICIEPPPIPSGEKVVSRFDELRLGLDSLVAKYILPQNVPWWKMDRRREYLEVIVREVGDDGLISFRHWDDKAWTLYDQGGHKKEGPTPHRYGRVPIIRLFDRTRPTDRCIGLPRYEAIAEIQREYYNRDSELILSDTTQAHPLLQGPEDFIQPDGTLPVGPNWLLPKKKTSTGTSVVYEGFDAIQFPKDGAESIRLNKADLMEAVDRAAMLLKPAGATGTGGRTVAQSGISKRLDINEGCDLLTEIASSLTHAENRIAALFMDISGNTSESSAKSVEITYPRTFNLISCEEMLMGFTQFLAAREGCGECKEVDKELLCRSLRLLLPGLADAEYTEFEAEIEEFLDRKAEEQMQMSELNLKAQQLQVSQPKLPKSLSQAEGTLASLGEDTAG